MKSVRGMMNVVFGLALVACQPSTPSAPRPSLTDIQEVARPDPMPRAVTPAPGAQATEPPARTFISCVTGLETARIDVSIPFEYGPVLALDLVVAGAGGARSACPVPIAPHTPRGTEAYTAAFSVFPIDLDVEEGVLCMVAETQFEGEVSSCVQIDLLRPPTPTGPPSFVTVTFSDWS